MNTEGIWLTKRKIYDHLVSRLEEFVPVDARWTIAEFGVGKWGFAKFYNERVTKVYGIDVQDYRQFHPDEIEFIISDGTSIPLEEEAVDMVVSHSVLEHVQDINTSLSEIDRITKVGGILFLTVSPLYFSSYGAHLNIDGKRLEGWEHLKPESPFFLTDNPLKGAKGVGHFLNGLTSSKFLAAVGRVPWNILSYQLSYEKRGPPDEVTMGGYLPLDLTTRGFLFIGQKNR